MMQHIVPTPTQEAVTLLVRVGAWFANGRWSQLPKTLREPLQAWHEDHQRAVDVRVAAIRANALAKLTPQEIEVLQATPPRGFVPMSPLLTGPICTSDLRYGFYLDRDNQLWWSVNYNVGVWGCTTLRNSAEASLLEWWALDWGHMRWVAAEPPVEGHVVSIKVEKPLHQSHET